jgi:hypothetical protein
VEQNSGSATYRLPLSADKFPRLLFIVAIIFMVIHTGVAYYHYKIDELPWLLRQLFDLDEENNLPTWFSGFILLVNSMLLWVCALDRKTLHDRWYRQWYVLAIGFLILSIDEIAGVHETINSSIEIIWAIPGGILAVILAIGFIPFLKNLPRKTALYFGLAGLIFIGGAIGMEIVGDPMTADSFEYYMATLVEEGMEMLGVIFFIRTLMQYSRRRGDGN